MYNTYFRLTWLYIVISTDKKNQKPFANYNYNVLGIFLHLQLIVGSRGFLVLASRLTLALTVDDSVSWRLNYHNYTRITPIPSVKKRFVTLPVSAMKCW